MSLNIAVIGSGIAGLTAASLLSKNHSVTIYEKKSQLGLGSEGILLDVKGEQIRVDVPPRVINEVHYPNLFQLLKENLVSTYPIYQQPNFSNANGQRVFSLWSGKTYLPFFGQRHITFPKLDWTNIKWLSQYGLQLIKWIRLLNSRTYEDLDLGVNLKSWLEQHKFSSTFIHDYLYSIWSLMCSANKTELDAYPARSMAQLFHHFSGFSCAHRIEGGTKSLEKELIKNVNNINLDAEVISVSPSFDGTFIITQKGKVQYDHVIIATEPSIANHLLSPDYKKEKELLAQVPYRSTEMVMHTDSSLMPKKKNDWTAVNMMQSKEKELWATVWMNPIEKTQLPFDLFQSWDPVHEIDETKVLARRQFHRSLLTPESAQAMESLISLQLTDENRSLWFAGSYLTSQVPLLEDGVRSARQVFEKINQLHTKMPQIKRPAA